MSQPHVPHKCPWGAWCSGAPCSWSHWWHWLSSDLGSGRFCQDRGSRRLDPSGHSALRWFPPPLHLLGSPIAVRRRGENNKVICKHIWRSVNEAWAVVWTALGDTGALYGNADARTASMAAQRAHFYNSIIAASSGSLHTTWFFL